VKVVITNFRIEDFGMHDHLLDIGKILIAFQCLLVKQSLALAGSRNIILHACCRMPAFSHKFVIHGRSWCKHLISEDCISHLRRMYQVRLKKTHLQICLFWLVLESIKEEGFGLLNHVLGHEDVDDAFNINKWDANLAPFSGFVRMAYRSKVHSMEITVYQPRILVEYCDFMTSISTVSQGFLFCCIFKISQPVS
jgi:hypothetical protein